MSEVAGVLTFFALLFWFVNAFASAVTGKCEPHHLATAFCVYVVGMFVLTVAGAVAVMGWLA